MLIYSLHSNGGKPLKMFGKDFGSFKRFANELKQGKYPGLSCIPEGLVEYVKLMLNATPEIRPDIHQLTKMPYFDDVGVKTLSYLDSLFQWDNLQKSKFYKGLPQIIQKLPHRISMFRILPCLSKEFVNPPMVPFVLPNVLLIAENCTPKEFTKNILPSLKPVMKIQEPIQILLIFMQKMELLLKLTPAEDVKTDVLPMLYRALESDAQQIQELCLSVLPTFASLVDYPAMKNALLPRIKRLCINTAFISVRVNCLLCIGKLLEHLDKWLVLDEIVPFLPQIPSREPAVLMGILGIYRLILNHNKLGITKELMATKVIPFLVPLCIENGLTLNQFNALISLVKDMINRVESEHKTKLEQLNSIQQENKQLDANFQTASGGLVPSVSPMNVNTEMDDMFSNLGLNSFMDNSTKTDISSQEINNWNSAMPTTSLSLEDKKRLVKEQEQVQRMQTQNTIVPQPVVQKIAPPPKDLTSSLMEANLKQINNNPTQINSSFPTTWNNSNNNWGAATTTGAATQNNSNWNNFQSTSSTQNNWSGTNTNQTSTTSTTNWNTYNQWPTPSQSNINQNNANQNWSAFDNLLPNNKNSKVPINQMQSSASQSLLMPQNNNSNQKRKDNVNVLSTEDIMDFLNN
jgi:SCY1-like protein 2